MRLTDFFQGSDLSDAEITGVSYDSRLVAPGDLFVAIPGTRADGHDFLSLALQRGAVAAIVSKHRVGSLPAGPWLAVDDTRDALALASAAFRGFPGRKLRMVGVTGTNGKTTTTHLIEAAIRACGQSSGVIGTLGARYVAGNLTTTVDLGFTTPQAPELQHLLAMMVDAGVGTVAMEVSSHALDQHRASHIGFEVGAFTNLSRDHLDYHGSEDAYALAKATLFAGLGDKGHAILNADDPRWEQMAAAGSGRVVTYALDKPADLTLRGVSLGPAGSSAVLVCPEGEFPLKTTLPGRFNLYNALAAVGCARSLGLPLAAALQGINSVQGVPGRVERVTPPGHPYAVMVDYAHTPDGLENVLRTVRGFTVGRVLVLFGCGGDRDRTKRPVMGEIASRLADLVVVTSDNPRSEDPEAIIADILPGISGESRNITDRAEAISWIISQAQPGDTILLAGKGHETYQLSGGRRIAFDDREVARLALRQARMGPHDVA